MTQTRFNLDGWLNKAFRNNVPPELVQIRQSLETRQIVFREMLTQCPRELRDALESLAEMHDMEAELTYGIIENLFKRHLEDHAPPNK